jgi:adenylosuccinate synthase
VEQFVMEGQHLFSFVSFTNVLPEEHAVQLQLSSYMVAMHPSTILQHFDASLEGTSPSLQPVHTQFELKEVQLGMSVQHFKLSVDNVVALLHPVHALH